MPMKKKFLTVLLCCALLLSGCSSQNTTTAEDSSSQTLQVGLAASDLFTARDPETGYDAETAARITLEGDTASCDSDAVTIDGSTITVKEFQHQRDPHAPRDCRNRADRLIIGIDEFSIHRIRP